MTEIRTETVPLVDGSDLRLTVAEPDGPTRGGIVVLHEARGVTDTIRQLITRIAEEGWLAVAPHLYHRDGADELGPEEPEERVADQVRRLVPQEVLADTDTAFGWLADHDVSSDRMGVVGFDVGGVAALMVAARRTMGAAVTVMGGETGGKQLAEALSTLVELASGLTCPWLGLYGEPADGSGVAELEQLRKASGQAGVAANVVVYPAAEHRFDADPVAAADAWQRMANWFDSHLR